MKMFMSTLTCMAFLADPLNSMAWIVRSHDLSGVGQAQHHWDLSGQEKDWGALLRLASTFA
jgi:hypothetical protein